MRGAKKSVSLFNYVLGIWIVLAIVIGLLGLAYWLYEEDPKGSKRFRSIRVGSYFTLDKRHSIVCQKVSRNYYSLRIGPGKNDRVRAPGGMPVYNVELPLE
jgi:hypothetical protein